MDGNFNYLRKALTGLPCAWMLVLFTTCFCFGQRTIALDSISADDFLLSDGAMGYFSNREPNPGRMNSARTPFRRVTLNTGAKPKKLYLRFMNVEAGECLVIGKDDTTYHQFGHLQPLLSNQSVYLSNYTDQESLVPLTIPQYSTVRVAWRTRGGCPRCALTKPVYLVSEKRLVKREQRHLLFSGALIGTLLLLCLLQAIYWKLYNYKLYGFALLFQAVFMGYLLGSHNFIRVFVFPLKPAYSAFYLMAMGGLAFFSYLLLLKKFLDEVYPERILLLLVQGMMIERVVSVAIRVTGYSLAYYREDTLSPAYDKFMHTYFVITSVGVCLLVLLINAYILFRVKNMAVRYFAVANGFLSIGVAGFIIGFLYSIHTISPSQFLDGGIIAQMVVFTIMIGQLSRQREKSLQQSYTQRFLQQELKRKQLMLNPHFMFNSLNAVRSLLGVNHISAAIVYLTRFAQLMRTVLSQSERSFVLLSEEYRFLNNYLLLEQSRFNYSFTFQFTISDQLDPDRVLLPPMIFQPLVENAIQHGIAGLPYAGSLSVSFCIQHDQLCGTVEDNGRGIQKEGAGSEHLGIASAIIEKRIKAFAAAYDKQSSITINPQAGKTGGTRVKLILPLIENIYEPDHHPHY